MARLGLKALVYVVWLYLIFVCALLLFAKGFLLKRVVVFNTSTCLDDSWYIRNLWNGISASIRMQPNTRLDFECKRDVLPKFRKSVLVVIDGLRYDFLLFNNSVKHNEELPFQNKMKKLHYILVDQPSNGKLYKFEADPPTTTMQRIKGLTTGSLPTFVDAGTNFDSYQITEDNILDQVLGKKQNISFMGCSTWTELFPRHFHRKIPFSALNVKDLDTIDYGIIKHLLPELHRDDWSLLIAHFLGVDHCGHRYGTHHPEMSRKLREMDDVISDLVNNIDDDTVLFVMGDHGMTLSGDHGGDSKDEVMAGLFVYSKRPMFSPNPQLLQNDQLAQISQIDLVPTLALLLDLPIPFSNLGSVIPDFFNASDTQFLPRFLNIHFDAQDVDNVTRFTGYVFKQINLAYVTYLNCKQLLTYVSEYQKLSKDLPRDIMNSVFTSFEFLEEKLEENLENLVIVDWTDKNKIQREAEVLKEMALELYQLAGSLQDILIHMKSVCRSIWAKFDIHSIVLGVTLMLFISCIVFVSPIFTSTETERTRFLTLEIFGHVFVAIALYFLAHPNVEPERSSWIVFFATSFSFSLWLITRGAFSGLTNPLKVYYSFVSLTLFGKFLLICSFAQVVSWFANSYIIHEDTVTLFFFQSALIFHLFTQILTLLRTSEVRHAGKKYQLKLVLHQKLFNMKNFRYLGFVGIAMTCSCITKGFWFCREMQITCNISPYSLPLVSLLSDFTKGYAHERLFLALVSLVSFTSLTYFYLRACGNLNGFNACVFTIKYISVICCGLIFLHWSLQVSNKAFEKLLDISYIQQIVLPRTVYVLAILCICWLIFNPTCVAVVYQQNKSANTIHELYSVLKQQLSPAYTIGRRPPLVYGLQTAYSSSIISVLLMLMLVVFMILTDGMAVPTLMLWIVAYCLLNIVSFDNTKEKITFQEMLPSVLVWFQFSCLGFFGSGHQTTIPAIRFQSAYIGFKGSLPEMIPQALVVLLNTFSSQILCALAFPLLLIYQNPNFRGSESSKNNYGEHRLLEERDSSRFHLFYFIILYAAIFMLRVSTSASSASFHRRHLMVWKIFAPRFMFEAVAFLITIPVLILAYLYFLRIDTCLRNVVNNIDETS